VSEPGIFDLKENTMRTASFIISILFALSFIFLGCSEDKTELAFINDDSSDGPINYIVWTEDSVEWANGDIGYDLGDKTESKEVDHISSDVSCLVNAGGGFVTAAPWFEDSNSSSLTIDDGSSNTYTLRAAVAK